MIQRIARKELTEIVRDGRFRVLAAVVVGVSLLSLAAGWKQYSDVNAQHRTAQAATRAQWLGQTRKNPHSAAHYGVYAFKPKSPLAVVDSGVDPYLGVAVWLEAHKQNELKYRPAQDRTAVQRFGELTAAEALHVLFPLFIVLMTFSAFSGEREQGTLRQLLSVGVCPRDLALGKAAGVALAIGLVLLPATLIAVAALTLGDQDGALVGDLSRAGLLALSYLVYFGLLIGISLAVSAVARSSRSALLILLTFWFVNSLVAPRVITDIAAAVYPTPSAVEFQQGLEADLGNQREIEERVERRKAELLARYNVASVDALPIAFSGVSLQEGEEHGNEVFDRHYGRLFDQYERQNRVFQLGGFVAPMLAVRALSMSLSGTDFDHHRNFTDAAESYRRDIQRVMNGDIAANTNKGQVYLAGRELWEKVPDFEYSSPSAGWAWATAASASSRWGCGWRSRRRGSCARPRARRSTERHVLTHRPTRVARPARRCHGLDRDRGVRRRDRLRDGERRALGTVPASRPRHRGGRGIGAIRSAQAAGGRDRAHRTAGVAVCRPAQPEQRRRTVRPALRDAAAGTAGAARDRAERSAAVLLQDLDRRAREHRGVDRARESATPARRTVRSRVRDHLPLSAADPRRQLQHAVGGKGAGHLAACAGATGHARCARSRQGRDPRRAPGRPRCPVLDCRAGR